jgi:hypothetical protein
MIESEPTDNSGTEAPAELESAAAPEPPRAHVRPAKKPPRRQPPIFDTVESASAKLSLDPTALRARLRRAQRAEGGSIVADLGGGITAFKLGKSWRIRFPER